MPSEKQENSSNNSGIAAFGFSQATEAVEKLRSVIEQASHSISELTHASEQWAQTAQERAGEMTKELRSQGGRVVGTVSQQVEHNPLTSLAIAFAVGFLVATVTRR